MPIPSKLALLVMRQKEKIQLQDFCRLFDIDSEMY